MSGLSAADLRPDSATIIVTVVINPKLKHAKERNVRAATWAPVVGLVGTVGGIVIAFARIGTEP